MPGYRGLLFLALAASPVVVPGSAAPDGVYPWLEGPVEISLEERIPPPAGFHRTPAAPASFAAWLRGLPLRAPPAPVFLFDGRLKPDQEAHHAVIDIDTGNRDLQQCADAVIRLRAEYLYAAGQRDIIAFHFTSGDLARWPDWRDGLRPRVTEDNRVSWHRTSSPDSTHANFRKYLDMVFTYAGTVSLCKELRPVEHPGRLESGDVFIQPGGHAVLVVDAAANEAGERVFLLAQSYMPAQDIHILRCPRSALDPWYPATEQGHLVTPHWTFWYSDLLRFP